jgi:hypothetical protein
LRFQATLFRILGNVVDQLLQPAEYVENRGSEAFEEELDDSREDEGEKNNLGEAGEGLEEKDVEEEISATADGKGEAPVDALDVDDPPWQVGQPKSQPLAYWVPSDAVGGKIWKQIRKKVDFDDRAAVAKVVKSRSLAIRRARKRHGLELSRSHRVYTATNHAFIISEHARYAATHGNHRIPYDELMRRYNLQFPGENRTRGSISGQISRIRELKEMRAKYA